MVNGRKDEEGNVYSDVSYDVAFGEMVDGVSNREITAAYASIANEGIYREPVLFTKVLDSDGNIILDRRAEESRVMEKSTAFLLQTALKNRADKIDISYFKKEHIDIGAIKSVTKNNESCWCMGFTPYYVGGMWCGFDDESKQEDNDYYVDMWTEIMKRVHEKTKTSPISFAYPDNISKKNICTKSGLLENPSVCENAKGDDDVRNEYFVKGTEPAEICNRHVSYNICKKSGLLAGEGCPKSEIEKKIFLIKEEKHKTKDSDKIVDKKMLKKCDMHK